MKYIKKLDLPKENPFEIDSFLAKNLNNNKYKVVSYYLTDNYVFIEYENVISPPPASGFLKR